jgi:hypothetical protein
MWPASGLQPRSAVEDSPTMTETPYFQMKFLAQSVRIFDGIIGIL